MDVREKLVELLADNCDMKDKRCVGCEEGLPEASECKRERFGKIADHLIAHGVTVQEWISVKDRLPEKQGFYRVYHKNSKAIGDRFYHKDCPDLFVNVKNDPITHWKPIEQPPKGE